MAAAPGAPVVLTPGDPAGIGAEIALKAHAAGVKRFAFIEDPDRLAHLAKRLDITLGIRVIDTPADIPADGDDLPVPPWSRTQSTRRFCNRQVSRTPATRNSWQHCHLEKPARPP